MEGLDLARLQRLIETSSKRKMSRVVKIEYVVEQERRERRERREMPVPDVVHPWRDGRPATHSTRLNYPRLRKVAHRSSAPLTPDTLGTALSHDNDQRYGKGCILVIYLA